MSAPTPEHFRDAMAQVPTPVTVVTTPGARGPAGATASAVSSLSLDPALMLVCLDRASRTLGVLEAAGRFAVNVLSESGEDHARAFASSAPHAEKWAGVPATERSGVPVLDGSLVWVVCELRDIYDGGDHAIVTGSVLEVGGDGGSPLLFVDRRYRGLG